MVKAVEDSLGSSVMGSTRSTSVSRSMRLAFSDTLTSVSFGYGSTCLTISVRLSFVITRRRASSSCSAALTTSSGLPVTVVGTNLVGSDDPSCMMVADAR